MEYKIRIPKFCGDVIPLYQVAWAMAVAKATAYGTEAFNESVYPVALQQFGELLMKEVNSGAIKICDERGFPIQPKSPIWSPITFDENYRLVRNLDREVDLVALKRDHPETEVRPGLFNITAVDLGPSQSNTLTNNLTKLHSKLGTLNKWGASTGDSFSIYPDPPPFRERAETKNAPAISLDATRAAATNPDAQSVSGAPESDEPAAVGTVHVRQLPAQRFQEQEILRVIRELGHTPTELPKDIPGKPGVKTEIRAQLSKFTTNVFNKAWERLSSTKEIIKSK